MPKEHQGIVVCIGIAAALLFFFISSINIDAQGAYFDELLQAPAAFAYRGIAPRMFSAVSLGSIPLLATGYVGTLKSALYGMFLSLTHSTFDIASWRMLGIILMMAGITVFAACAGKALGYTGLCVFFAFLLTDQTVILATRHDWGPVALLFLLRLVMISVWLRLGMRQTVSPWSATLFGICVGIGLYEQFSALITVIPVLIMIMTYRYLKFMRSIVHFAAGVAVGSLPLVIANIVSFLRKGSCSTINAVAEVFSRNYVYCVRKDFFPRYLSMGNGEEVKGWLLAVKDHTGNFELIMMGSSLALVALGLMVCFKRPRFAGRVDHGCLLRRARIDHEFSTDVFLGALLAFGDSFSIYGFGRGDLCNALPYEGEINRTIFRSGVLGCGDYIPVIPYWQHDPPGFGIAFGKGLSGVGSFFDDARAICRAVPEGVPFYFDELGHRHADVLFFRGGLINVF